MVTDSTRSSIEPSSSSLASRRLGLISRGDMLQKIPITELAKLYFTNQDVYLGQGRWWKWQRDGLPNWFVQFLMDADILEA